MMGKSLNMKGLVRFLSLILCFYLTQVTPVKASDRELALKAGLIFNFAVYSKGDWFHSGQHADYLICSPDADFVKVARKTLQNKKVKTSPVVIQFTPINKLQSQHCHSIFFSANSKLSEHYDPINHSFTKTMLIGDSDGFINRGGHINFFLAGGKVRFEINPTNLIDSHIEVSSKVIRLGKLVKGSTHD